MLEAQLQQHSPRPFCHPGFTHILSGTFSYARVESISQQYENQDRVPNKVTLSWTTTSPEMLLTRERTRCMMDHEVLNKGEIFDDLA